MMHVIQFLKQVLFESKTKLMQYFYCYSVIPERLLLFLTKAVNLVQDKISALDE